MRLLPVSSPRLGVLAALLLVACVRSAGAQGPITGGVAAAVDILFPMLTGVGTRPLDFGVILPGETRVVIEPRTPSGGEFRIKGLKRRRSGDISFVLPARLTGPGGASIPLSFDGSFAAACEIDATDVCRAASLVTWNPVVTPVYRYVPSGADKHDQLDLYLGGVALPAATQPAGRYSGSITVLITVN